MGYAYPIDSKVVANPNGTIDYDRASSSTQLRGLIKSMITNGVNLTESTNLQVMADEETMNLVVKPGYVIIEGALKHFEEDVKVTIGVADTTNPRIDTVVARLNLNEDVRDIVIDVLQGTPSAEPMAPELTRTTSYYEVGLADILVELGTTQISQAVVTDTRLLNSRCGMISAIGEIDTETLFNQLTTDFDNWFESIKGKLGDDVAGSLQMQIDGLADDIDTLQEDVESLESDTTTLQSDMTLVKDTLGYTASKNLLENTGTTTTSNGITFTVNDDGSVTANGTSTSDSQIFINRNFYLSKGEYILSGRTGTPNSNCIIQLYDGVKSVEDQGLGKTYSCEGRTITYVRIYINKAGVSFDNVTFYPMIRKADITDDTYEPYGKVDVDTRLNSILEDLKWKEIYSFEKAVSSSTSSISLSNGTSYPTVDITPYSELMIKCKYYANNQWYHMKKDARIFVLSTDDYIGNNKSIPTPYSTSGDGSITRSSEKVFTAWNFGSSYNNATMSLKIYGRKNIL